MNSFLNTFSPQPILVDFGFVQIYWYGLLLCLAGIICLLIWLKIAKQEKEDIYNLAFYLLLFGFIGSRLWHVLFYNFAYFSSHPWQILAVWHGGLSIWGGLISGVIVLYYYAKKRALSFWQLADALGVILPLGQAIGRWGNYFNQELFGRPCNASWCIYIDPLNRPADYVAASAFQPLFLYESILCFLLFIILYLLFNSRRYLGGSIALWYLAGYSVIRFSLEFMRLDSAPIFAGLKATQWLCLAVIVSSVIFFIIKKKIHNRISL